jgi:hypothetical protein
MTTVRCRKIDPTPVPEALFDKQDTLARALSDLLVETTRLGLSSADAVNIAFSTVAQIVCHGVPLDCDQDLLRFFASAVVIARTGDGALSIGNMMPVGTA